MTSDQESLATALKFEQAINSRDIESVCGLLTRDSVFIDSLGNRLEGIDKIRAGWRAYFGMVPDYSISHSEIFAHESQVAIFGSARGTLSHAGALNKENFWQTPAAWRAVVSNGRIAVWQVFADNEPIRAIMRRLG
jgi:ketosteroid isomerase-like protein